MLIFFLFFCVNRAYEDIIDMNKNSNKNPSTTIDDEEKFKVVCLIECTQFLNI